MTTTEASQRREIERLRKKVADLTEVLRWYGNEDNYDPMTAPLIIREGRTTYSTMAAPVMLDRGKRAREAGC